MFKGLFGKKEDNDTSKALPVASYDYHSQQVRTLLIDGEPWFVAKDVCGILELGNVGQALTRLDEDEVTDITLNDVAGRPNHAKVVNEPGLYSLILASRKPQAKDFRRWVTHEVLPAIRKTGSYAAKELSRLELLEMALDSERKRIEVEEKLAIAEPLAEKYRGSQYNFQSPMYF